MTAALGAIFTRDLRLALRHGGGAALGLVFFLLIVAMTPLAIGPDPRLLARIGPAMLWLAAVLSTLLGLDRLFQQDVEDGSLDLLRLAATPLELVVLAKAAAHWVVTGLPLAIAAPLYGLLLALTPAEMLAVSVTLLVGTPALVFIGAAGAALTAGMRRGGLLLAIISLPLMAPVLIFGVSATQAATDVTSPFLQPVLFLSALVLFSGVTGCVAAAAALRSGG
ncbi:heme exporter protein CcmB [Camelimonas abortus]|uniref:Heme exporter protein B n=1 Tax=Camelimonas abortus TaxID=1017184 RepID=A0ABV7LC30_9HYPH